MLTRFLTLGILTAVVFLAGCGPSGPSSRQAVTATATITVSAPPPQTDPAYGVMSPKAEAALRSACEFLDGYEPSWDSLTEVGPYQDSPMDARAVLFYAKQADKAYRGTFERLDPMSYESEANANYGKVLADIDFRSGLSSALRSSAKEYIRTGAGYESLYYFWAAYTASIEIKTSGCSEYSG